MLIKWHDFGHLMIILNVELMKKPLILLLITFGINVMSAQITNQRKENSKVIITKAPKKVNNMFESQYPGVKPIWSLEDNNYRASYTDVNTKLNHYILYTKQGEIISKESEMDYTDYPISINKYYSQRFPEEKFRIIKCEASNGETYYFAKHKAAIIKFDTTGNFINDKSEKVKLYGSNKSQELKKIE